MFLFLSLEPRLLLASAPLLRLCALLAARYRTARYLSAIMGLGEATDFALYHHVLSRARWSSLAAGRKLFAMIIGRFAPDGAVVIGLDDTIERRWGAKIAARGIYRDPACPRA